jgi:hypothetical protein
MAGFDTMMNPIRDANISASKILWVANMYAIRNSAGTSEKKPNFETSLGSMAVSKTMMIKTIVIVNKVRLPLKVLVFLENIFNNYHLSFRN